MIQDPTVLTHPQRLEADSIQLMREVAAEADKPVLLFSVCKDSAVLRVGRASGVRGARRDCGPGSALSDAGAMGQPAQRRSRRARAPAERVAVAGGPT